MRHSRQGLQEKTDGEKISDFPPAKATPKHIGVLIQTGNNYGREIVRGVTRFMATTRNFRLVLHTEPSVHAFEHLDWLAGAVVSPSNAAMIEALRTRSIPIVNVSSTYRDAGWPTLCINDLEIGNTAANYLLSHGYQQTRVAVMPGNPVAEQRAQGFLQTMTRAGAQAEKLDASGVLGGEGWHRLGRTLAGLPKPMGLFAFDDGMARLLNQSLLEAEVRVPEEVALIGSNNDDLLCEILRPTITSIACPFDQLGYQAGQLLVQLIEGMPAPTEAMMLPPGGVVERESTGLFATSDRRLTEVLIYMNENACNPVHVVDVVRELKINRRWLERTFSEHMYCTPHEYLNQKRLDRARQLLRDTHLSVPQIADQSGFKHEPSLRRAFNARYQQTPAEYRRQFGHP